MKKKFLLPILSVCMVVALVSVGFAAWLITGNETTGASGDFETHDVTNEFFTAKVESNDATINFGKKDSNPAVQKPWFTFDSTVGEEDLEATFTVTVTSEATGAVENVLNKNDITFTLTTKNNTYDNLAADDKKYVAYPTMTTTKGTVTSPLYGDALNGEGKGLSITLTKDHFTVDTEKTNATATVKVTFAWGDYFKKDGTVVNPYVYFNGLEGGNNQANREAATKVMTAIKGLKSEGNVQDYDITLAVVAQSGV